MISSVILMAISGIFASGLLVQTGTDEDDHFRGTDENDALDGQGGDDILRGNLGDDVVVGGDGNDIVAGGHGEDALSGGEGNDIIRGGHGDDELVGGTGEDMMNGGRGDDSLFGEDGNDDMNGWRGHDYLDGGNGDDTLIGWRGGDILVGGAGHDILDGGIGKDQMSGGDGDDLIVALRGADVMDGGEGSDIFVIGERSDAVIKDMVAGEDLLVIDYDGTGPEPVIKIDRLSDDSADIYLNDERIATLHGKLGELTENDIALRDISEDNLDYATIRDGGPYPMTPNDPNPEIDDIIKGTDEAEELHGKDGNDTIFAGKGDVAIGGEGDDILVAEKSAWDVVLHGGEGADFFVIDSPVASDNAGEADPVVKEFDITEDRIVIDVPEGNHENVDIKFEETGGETMAYVLLEGVVLITLHGNVEGLTPKDILFRDTAKFGHDYTFLATGQPTE